MSTILAKEPQPQEGPPGIRNGPTLLIFDLAANKVITDAALDSIDQYLLQPDHIVWLDLANPDLKDIQCLREEFHFHELALEDVSKAHQRPKLEHYDGYLFMVAYSTVFNPLNNTFYSTEVDLFIGKNYLVTAHGGPIPTLDMARQRWTNHREQLAEGAGFLAYLILDGIVDEYFPALESISDVLEDLEVQIFENLGTDTSFQGIFALKKELLHFRRLVVPLRDAISVVARWDSPLFGPHTAAYFRDIYDHLLRASDSIDTFRDLLSSAIELYMSVTSNRMNAVMKTLTVISTVLMTVAMVSGIYGMNFKIIPELQWEYGYYYSLGLMAVLVMIVLGFFKWKKYI